MLSSPYWKLTLVTKHQVSLQCPTTTYPCSAQPQSILTVPNRKVSLQCSTTEYPCSAQSKVSLQCPIAKYPCSAQLQSILAVSGPTEEYPCSAQSQSIPGVPNSKMSTFLQRNCNAARKTVDGGQGDVTLLVQQRL